MHCTCVVTTHFEADDDGDGDDDGYNDDDDEISAATIS